MVSGGVGHAGPAQPETAAGGGVWGRGAGGGVAGSVGGGVRDWAVCLS
eukprot:COSAG04_NODE_30928_length_260_cov_0.440994_1_plen_47_part_10